MKGAYHFCSTFAGNYCPQFNQVETAESQAVCSENKNKNKQNGLNFSKDVKQ